MLERAGLVKRSVQGRTHICRLDARPMHAGVEWIRHYEQFWQQRIDVLEALLEAEDAAKAKPQIQNRTLNRKEEDMNTHECDISAITAW